MADLIYQQAVGNPTQSKRLPACPLPSFFALPESATSAQKLRVLATLAVMVLLVGVHPFFRLSIGPNSICGLALLSGIAVIVARFSGLLKHTSEVTQIFLLSASGLTAVAADSGPGPMLAATFLAAMTFPGRPSLFDPMEIHFHVIPHGKVECCRTSDAADLDGTAGGNRGCQHVH